MRVHVLQHADFEGPANIRTWCFVRGIEVTTTRFYESGWILPEPQEINALVVMGGPMSANDEAEYPWLVDEKQYIRSVIAQDLPVLGICLGAQLLASALGARVYKNRELEIGWFPIVKTGEGENNPFCAKFPKRPMVFHWHGDTYELPSGAINLFASEACTNQAFILGDKIVGLQFHIEVTPGYSIEGFIANGAADLAKNGKYVQSVADIRAGMSNNTRSANISRLLEHVLEHLLSTKTRA